MLASPYAGVDDVDYFAVTQDLVADFPLDPSELMELVHFAWDDLFATRIGGNHGLRIGEDIFLPAQCIGIMLEKLIAQRLADDNPRWRGGVLKPEKDIIDKTDPYFSFEIKTSSNPSGIFGNRSTGHVSDDRSKHRTGYYLVVNYKVPTEADRRKGIVKIRFGWLDDDDWVGQTKPTGQSAQIPAAIAQVKLVTLYQRRPSELSAFSD